MRNEATSSSSSQPPGWKARQAWIADLVRHCTGFVGLSDDVIHRALVADSAYQFLCSATMGDLLAVSVVVGYSGVYVKKRPTRDIPSRALVAVKNQCHLTAMDSGKSHELRAASRLVRNGKLGCVQLFPLPAELATWPAPFLSNGRASSNSEPPAWMIMDLLVAARFPACLLRHAVRFSRAPSEIDEPTELLTLFQRAYQRVSADQHRAHSRVTNPKASGLLTWLVYAIEFGELLTEHNPDLVSELARLLPKHGIPVPIEATADRSATLRQFVLAVITHATEWERSRAADLRAQVQACGWARLLSACGGASAFAPLLDVQDDTPTTTTTTTTESEQFDSESCSSPSPALCGKRSRSDSFDTTAADVDVDSTEEPLFGGSDPDDDAFSPDQSAQKRFKLSPDDDALPCPYGCGADLRYPGCFCGGASSPARGPSFLASPFGADQSDSQSATTEELAHDVDQGPSSLEVRSPEHGEFGSSTDTADALPMSLLLDSEWQLIPDSDLQDCDAVPPLAPSPRPLDDDFFSPSSGQY